MPANAPDYSNEARIIGLSITVFIVISTLIMSVIVYKKRWRQDRDEKYGNQIKRTSTEQKLSIEKVDEDSLMEEDDLDLNTPKEQMKVTL